MSQTISPDAETHYGVQWVYRIWEETRSTFYNTVRQSLDTQARPNPKRRGPRPAISDEALLGLIQVDHETTPFTDEGHCKVWARYGIASTSRKIMANQL